MSESKVISTLEGIDVTIQCSPLELMKDICQKYANKILKNISSLLFIYGGSQINFKKKFLEQASMIDKERNIMHVLVYKYEDYLIACPKCRKKIKLNKEKIDDIVTSINKMNDTIDGSKLIIENIIKSSSMNSLNNQLKNVNLILNSLHENINKINAKLKNLLDDIIINENESENENKIQKGLNLGKIYYNFINFIIAEILIKQFEVNEKVRILNSYEEKSRTCKLKMNDDFRNEEEIKKCEISINGQLIPFNYFYKFKSDGKYAIKYLFKNNIQNMVSMFYDCSSLTYIN